MHPPHALLKFHRIPGHVDVHHTARHLQVDTLTAGARRDQIARTVRTPEGIALLVALRIGLAADNHRWSPARRPFEVTSESGDGLDGLRKQHYLLVPRRVEEALLDQAPFLITACTEDGH